MENILIIDYDGRGRMIARKVRDCNVYCEVKTKYITADEVDAAGPKGIILSGADKAGFDIDIPVLAVAQDIPYSLREFLYGTVGCTGQWTTSAYIEKEVAAIREKVGDKRVILGLSGGVDSCVCAAILNKAIGRQLICIFVDHGLMRKNESQEVEGVFKNQLDVNLVMVDAEDRFLARLKGVTDPEMKRKIIGEEFIRVFEDESKKHGSIDFLAQGTIYPDIIESGAGGGTLVKSHHNVGGLPERIGFKGILEPIKYLFKDEVRRVGEALGLPKPMVWRQPFPGPGLAVRCIGEVTKDRLEILRDADKIFRDEISAAGLDRELSQYFAVITDMKSVGVAKSGRTYDYTLALRAVTTDDFMTSDWARIPYGVLEKIVKRIVSEVSHINRVVYDITTKPPSTIEWE